MPLHRITKVTKREFMWKKILCTHHKYIVCVWIKYAIFRTNRRGTRSRGLSTWQIVPDVYRFVPTVFLSLTGIVVHCLPRLLLLLFSPSLSLSYLVRSVSRWFQFGRLRQRNILCIVPIFIVSIRLLFSSRTCMTRKKGRCLYNNRVECQECAHFFGTVRHHTPTYILRAKYSYIVLPQLVESVCFTWNTSRVRIQNKTNLSKSNLQ